MTAPAEYTWDFNSAEGKLATAASLDDLGSAQLVDDPEDPPIPPEMPYADQLNQWALQLAGTNRVIEGVTIEVTISGGTPAIANVKAMSSIITTTWAQSNITVTDNGAGDVTLSWDAGVLPSPRGKPEAWVTEDGAFLQPTAVLSGNSVRVKIRNASSVLTDANFAVRIF